MSQEVTGDFGNSSDKIPSVRSRKWCLTLNNYSKNEYDELLSQCHSKKWKYIFGKEVGEENMTPHIQGYIEHDEAIRLSTLKKICKRGHFEKSKGSRDQNYNYCCKDGEFETNLPKPIIKCKNVKEAREKVLEEIQEAEHIRYCNLMNKLGKIVSLNKEEYWDEYKKWNNKITEPFKECKKSEKDKESISSEEYYHDWE